MTIFLDEDGYPTDDALDIIRYCPFSNKELTHFIHEADRGTP